MKTYHGYRDARGAHVFVNDDGTRRLLDHRFDLANHSPTGFEWGYGGSGPAQLSLAILADALGRSRMALRLYQKFKWHTVARLAADTWELSHDDVLNVVAQLGAEEVREES